MTQPLTDRQLAAEPGELGTLVRRRRINASLTIQELSRLSGLSRESIRACERGWLQKPEAKCALLLQSIDRYVPHDWPTELRTFRARAGLTQVQAAKLAGLAKSTWEHAEHDFWVRGPTGRVRSKLEAVLRRLPANDQGQAVA
jgi:DNA-binding XRE family transcriptional regulator